MVEVSISHKSAEENRKLYKSQDLFKILWFDVTEIDITSRANLLQNSLDFYSASSEDFQTPQLYAQLVGLQFH